MKKFLTLLLFICVFLIFLSTSAFAGRPFITHLYNADPSAHVFENRVYVYPSHDKNVSGWFDMEDYHVYSSADLKQWIDHGVVLHYKDADWVAQPDPAGATPPAGIQVYDPQYQHPRFWAPDCAVKSDPQGSTYYFYYCAHDKNVTNVNDPQAFKIAVATSKSPAGPFVPVSYNNAVDPYGNTNDPLTGAIYDGQTYIPGSYSMDPCVFVDDDGSAYMVFGGQGYGGIPDGQGPRFVKLKDNMIEFDGAPQEITSGVDYWFEASWIHSRVNPIDGKKWYYLSYSTGTHDPDDSDSTIHYAMNDDINDINGWEYKGEVIDTVIGWTNHHSFAKYKTDPFGNEIWYAFFHNTEMAGPEPEYMGRRSICVAQLNYNVDATMMLVDQSSMTTIDAFSRIKAMLYIGQSGVQNTEDITSAGEIVDIGKQVSHIENDDYIYFNNVDFGSIGATGFQATVASATTGGTIEIRDGSTTGTLLGTLTVSGTGSWSNWVTINHNLSSRVTGKKNIYLVFKGSGFLFNLDWFKFIRPGSIPVGYSVGFKSLNPNCIDIYENKGQKYLCVETLDGQNQDLCANRPGIWGGWEKFSVLDYNYDSSQNNLIELNSSNNGKNLCSNGFNIPINASGGDYRGTADNEVFYWISNSDGTISFKNLWSNYFLCTDTWEYGHGNNPAKVYDNRPNVGGIGEKFYCEIGDAPIGCIVAFKSLNPNCIDNQGNMGTKYLCIDTDKGRDLCTNRPAVGGAWEKFLVVDAENGYIALKSLNNNQYLRCNGTNTPINANGEFTIDSNSERFQWRNNGDGTVSLKNVQYNMFLCVDTTGGKSNNPAKTYANRPAVVDVSYSYEKFYCQVINE